MVEHRTENSGVGGSIPFIGSLKNYFLKKLLIQHNSICKFKPIYQRFYLFSIIERLNFTTVSYTFQPSCSGNLLAVSTQHASKLNIKSTIKYTGTLTWKKKKDKLWWLPLVMYQADTKNLGVNFTNYFWFLGYLQLYLYGYLGYRLEWQLINVVKLIRNSKFILWWHKLFSEKVLRAFSCSAIKFFYILTNIIFFKNIDFFVKLVQKILIQTPIKRHKKYFYQIRAILTFIFKLLKPQGKILGYSIFFRGKLGRKGSVKKSTFFYKYGRVSLANKSLRTNFRKFLVYTETGVIGCCIHLFF